jgi:flavin-binding protein dodecin
MLPLEENILINQWVQKAKDSQTLLAWYEVRGDLKKIEILGSSAKFVGEFRFG